MTVEVAVLSFPCLIVRTVSVDVKQHLKKKTILEALELCVKVEVDVLTVLMVSVDVKQH